MDRDVEDVDMFLVQEAEQRHVQDGGGSQHEAEDGDGRPQGGQGGTGQEE